jgi:hypothetical protein
MMFGRGGRGRAPSPARTDGRVEMPGLRHRRRAGTEDASAGTAAACPTRAATWPGASTAAWSSSRSDPRLELPCPDIGFPVSTSRLTATSWRGDGGLSWARQGMEAASAQGEVVSRVVRAERRHPRRSWRQIHGCSHRASGRRRGVMKIIGDLSRTERGLVGVDIEQLVDVEAP